MFSSSSRVSSSTSIPLTHYQFENRPFKVANLTRWIVIVNGPTLIEELRRGADDVLSFPGAAEEVLMREEMVAAFEELVPPSDDGWKSIPAHSSIMHIICRISNRVFVGLPLCRDPTYLDLCTGFARQAVTAMMLISMTPPFLRPLAAKIISGLQGTVPRVQRYITGLLRERTTPAEEGGAPPNDLITWLMDESRDRAGAEDPLRDMSLRLLAVNFAAIHTTSMVSFYGCVLLHNVFLPKFTSSHHHLTYIQPTYRPTPDLRQALYNLAANPAYAALLRNEVQCVVRKEGWNKDSIGKMYLLDSFLRETMRMRSLRDRPQALHLPQRRRRAHPIPAGVLIFAATPPAHFDIKEYGRDVDGFDGLRFVPEHQYDLQEQQENPLPPSSDEILSPRNFLVSTSASFLGWGLGKHQCPGRFFAAVEMKMMLAYVVGRFDVLTMDVGQVGSAGREGKEGAGRTGSGRMVSRAADSLGVADSDGESTCDGRGGEGLMGAGRFKDVEEEHFRNADRPDDLRIEANCFPNPWARLRIRRRARPMLMTP
ncbi:hypothetical protein BD626DRAFT_535397 [Schizophyllum amplum]|uniref:Cytochrome P450 n=1 Tax=Schizophyllum amplum TaxID=97359 RepID=A0A550CMC2_9AGAR|nr:hypothetical protein BD626DRAFT_535397 [Auriculariopsis ampla]